MPRDLTTTVCPVCNKAALASYRHDWLFRCECGLLGASFPVEIPTTQIANQVDEGQRKSGLEPLRQLNNAKLLDVLARNAPAAASLLDVGSGPGFLLSQALEAGFRAEGVEPDANVIPTTRLRGAPVRHGFFPDVLEEGETFDIIVFNDVLEHIPALSETLAAAAKALKPGGLLCLNCPDKRGLFFRVAAALDRVGVSAPYARLWQRGLPSPHVWYFSPALLDRAVARAGLSPIEETRLETIELGGLWARIRCVDESLITSIASWLFAVASYPFAKMLPSDATASLYRRPA